MFVPCEKYGVCPECGVMAAAMADGRAVDLARYAMVEHRSQWEHAWAPYGADMTVRGPDAESPRG